MSQILALLCTVIYKDMSFFFFSTGRGVSTYKPAVDDAHHTRIILGVPLRTTRRWQAGWLA